MLSFQARNAPPISIGEPDEGRACDHACAAPGCAAATHLLPQALSRGLCSALCCGPWGGELAGVKAAQTDTKVAMIAGRRMLQAASAHNISATFAYDTTPTVAASFPGTFTADRYTYQLQQQGEPEFVYLMF